MIKCFQTLFVFIGSKHPDPMMGAGPGLQARIVEMVQLELDTIRYEKTKKTKKKIPAPKDCIY